MQTHDAPSTEAALDAEWRRVELLARALAASRAGREPDENLLAELRVVQGEVLRLRRGPSAWDRVLEPQSPPLVRDVLACIVAPEANPALSWAFQELSPGGGPGVATAGLIQLLLALRGEEVRALRSLVGPAGELARQKLVRCEAESVATAALHATPEVVAALLGERLPDPVLPGAVQVRRDASWSELVLPPDREVALRELLLLIRQRDTVVRRWGGIDTGGPVALFCGPSGTGKTFAAGVLAGELGWPLYCVDLASLVSKYVGETEKNIGRLLDAAHGRELVLQFDEADALMSKRGEIREARDRYANMEVSYLLARIEQHSGPCILTTNLRKQIDSAFVRRLHLVVEFPRPDEAARELLWERMLPPGAPREPEVSCAFLARANLTGGGIRNAALHGAFLAAGEARPISLADLAVGVWREQEKDRPQLALTDLGPLAEFLPSHVREEGR